MARGVGTKIDMNTIGGRIKYARKRKKISQLCLSMRTGCCCEHTISELECGKHIPKLKTLNGIADALGVDPEWIMTGKGGEKYAEGN